MDPLQSSGGSPHPCLAGSPGRPKTTGGQGEAGASPPQTRALESLSKPCAPAKLSKRCAPAGLSKRCSPELGGPEQGEGPGEDAPEEAASAPKPPYSYVSLIAMAIEASPAGRLPLRAIYQYIAGRFPYYRLGQRTWQNSVRHNLSLHECFVKLPRSGGPRKGCDWTLDPACRGAFEPGKSLRRRRARSSPKPNPAPPRAEAPARPPCGSDGCLWVPPSAGQPPSHAVGQRPAGIVPLGLYEPGPRLWIPGGVAPPQPLLLQPSPPVPAFSDLPFFPYWSWPESAYIP